MFVELRSYRLLPGSAADYFALYEAKGMRIQLQYLPTMFGYYQSEIGDLNQAVHLWGHESLDARETNRARMRSDPAFKAYWNEVRPLILEQKNQILRAAPFFEERLAEMMKMFTVA